MTASEKSVIHVELLQFQELTCCSPREGGNPQKMSKTTAGPRYLSSVSPKKRCKTLGFWHWKPKKHCKTRGFSHWSTQKHRKTLGFWHWGQRKHRKTRGFSYRSAQKQRKTRRFWHWRHRKHRKTRGFSYRSTQKHRKTQCFRFLATGRVPEGPINCCSPREGGTPRNRLFYHGRTVLPQLRFPQKTM